MIERWEDLADRKFYEMTKGLPEGKFRCSCGDIEDLSNANTATPNPYSEPICRKCMDKLIKSRDGQNN